MTEIKGFFGDSVLAAAGGEGIDGIDLKRILAGIDALWDHKDELIRLAQTLPNLLGETGEMIHLAGQGAQRASGFLTDEVRDITAAAAHVLAVSQAQLRNVVEMFGHLGRVLQKVPFIDNLGDTITDGVNALIGVADNVNDVSTKIRGLGDKLGDVGSDLDRVGQSLVGGGALLADFGGKKPNAIKPFAGLPPTKPVKVAKPAPVRKPTPAKKSAPK